jgi:circadian clock protein KaiC
MSRFGFDFQKLTRNEKFEFVDLTTVTGEAISDALDLVLSQVTAMRAKRLVVDSFTALAQGFEKLVDARIALQVILGRLVREEGCTTLLLVEMPYGTDRIGLGIEEFVADGIIVLDFVNHKGGPQRTINIKKMRGTQIRLDTSTYSISSKDSFLVFPAIELSMNQGLGERRIPTHIPGFDQLIEGGFLERSVSALTGVAGTGKSTFALEYIYNGAKEDGEKGLFISYGESKDQLEVIARKLGMNKLDELTQKGLITIAGIIPEKASIEAHLVDVQRLFAQTKAKRVVFDDITGLKSICTDDEFYLLIKNLTQLAKSKETTALLTLTTNELAGFSITGMGLSTVMDSIILMRYVEVEGRMDRSMILLKMRGTKHDNIIRKFSIGKGGIVMQGNFVGYDGILSGSARRSIVEFEESERDIAKQEQEARVKRRQAFSRKMKEKRH